MAKGETTVGIIGLGLIGGSAAIRLREAGFAERFIGYDVNKEHAEKAVELGIVDDVLSLDDLTSRSDVVLLAIPVNHALKVLPEVLTKINEEAVLLDFGSTKHQISTLADQFANRQQFVACHPIAGTENTGPSAAFANLFHGKVNIICDREKSSQTAMVVAEALSEALGMKNKYMNSREHDRHIAYVSHMSHVSSFILGQTVLEVEKNEQNIFDMAGSGFASTVRLAKSSPDMWAPIFTENAENVLEVVNQYLANLKHFKQLLEDRNEEALKRIMAETNVIRKVLKK
jgi:prephenate dehydrogenase